MVLEREHHDPRAQADPPGLARRGRGHQERIRDEGIAGEVVLGEPAGPVAELVHEPDFGELLLVALPAGLPFPAVAEDQVREVHSGVTLATGLRPCQGASGRGARRARPGARAPRSDGIDRPSPAIRVTLSAYSTDNGVVLPSPGP